jgi:hypothetical protein
VNNLAYEKGYREGRADGFAGRRNEHSWFSANEEDAYTRNFGQGYRDGFENAKAARSIFRRKI